jgi:hypothetical protein
VTGATVSQTEKYILPFSVFSEKRSKPFTSDMELAAVFSMAEIHRRKVRRMILRRSKERFAFIAKTGYPMWLFPFSGSVLLFDGLKASKYSLPYAQISDVKAFADNLRVSSTARETHIAFLAHHTEYFSKPTEEKKLPLEGLIGNSAFLSEMDLFRREASKMKKQSTFLGLLSSLMNESQLSLITNEMTNLLSSFEKDIKTLNVSILQLGKSSQVFHKELHGKSKEVKDTFAIKIKEEEAIVAPQVKTLREISDRKIFELIKNVEHQQLPLQAEKLKLEKSKEEINERITQYGLEARIVSESNDVDARQRVKQKIKNAKQNLSDLETQLKNTEKTLQDIEKKKASDISVLRSELEDEIKKARKNLVELEATRDAKVLVIKQEMENLENLTKLVSDQIRNTVKIREVNIAEFEKLFLKPTHEERNRSLIYVPFYVICYDSGPKRRYFIIPPSIVGNLGISAKLKGALGKARIKSILAPRFKEIASLAEIIQELSQKSTLFETELRDLGTKNNILATPSTRAEIEKGLLSLREQGWLSDKNYGAIIAGAKTA